MKPLDELSQIYKSEVVERYKPLDHEKNEKQRAKHYKQEQDAVKKGDNESAEKAHNRRMNLTSPLKRQQDLISKGKGPAQKMKKKLNTEEIDVEEGFRNSQSQSRIDLYKKQTNRKARKMYDSGYKVATGKGTPEDEKTHAKSKEQIGKVDAVDNYMRQIGKSGRKKGLPKTQGEKDAVAMAKKRMKPEDKKKQAAVNKKYGYDIMGEETMNETKEGLMKVGREQYKKEKEEGRYGGTKPSNPRVAKLMKKMKEESDHDKEVAKYRDQAKKKTTMPAGDVGHDIHKRAVAQYNKQNPSKKVKESFSNWRDDLREVIDIPSSEPKTDDEMRKPIKEKKVKNKVVINPDMKESVEELDGVLLEHIEFNYEMISDLLFAEGSAQSEEEVNYLIENIQGDDLTDLMNDLADLYLDEDNMIVPGPHSSEHKFKKERDKRTKAAFALSDKEKEAAAKRRKEMENKANLERSVKKPDAEPAHKGYYSRMKGGLEKTFKKPSATHRDMKKEEMSFDKADLQKKASRGDRAAMKKLHDLRAAGKIGKEYGFEPGAKRDIPNMKKIEGIGENKDTALDMVRRSVGKALIDTKAKKKEMSPEEKKKEANRRYKNYLANTKKDDPYKARPGESD